MATTAQQGEDIPATSESEGSLAPGPSSGPAHPPRTPPLPVPPLPDIPFVGTPPVGHPFAEFLVISTQKTWVTLPVVHFMIIMTRRPMLTPKRSKLGMNRAVHRVMRTCPNWFWKLGPALTDKSRNLPAPSSPTRATADLDDGTVAGSSRSTTDQSLSHSDSSREDVVDSDMDTTCGDYITCLDTDKVNVGTAQKKYQKRVQASCRLSKVSLWTKA